MNKKTTYTLLFFILISYFAVSQESNDSSFKKVYTYYTNELIFQFSETESSNLAQLNGVRSTFLPNLCTYTHINYTDNFGLIVGFSMKNIGLKTFDEKIDTVIYDKITRRVLVGSSSIAVKYGSFLTHNYLYLGTGYDIAFHYRQKFYSSAIKEVKKQGEWFSNATERFLPTVFIGYQFPFGLNVQLLHYYKNFLNHSYNEIFGNFTKFNKSQLFYLSLSLQINKNKKSKDNESNEVLPESVDL